jgi:porin
VNLHGFRWRLNGANGFFFPNEAQFRWNQSAEEKGLQGQFKAGAWFHTARFARLGEEGTVRGNYGWYFILDQMLCPKPGETPATTSKDKDDAQKPDQGLGAFGRLAFEPQDRNFIGFYFDTGLNYKGLIPTRDNDILGAVPSPLQHSMGPSWVKNWSAKRRSPNSGTYLPNFYSIGGETSKVLGYGLKPSGTCCG